MPGELRLPRPLLRKFTFAKLLLGAFLLSFLYKELCVSLESYATVRRGSPPLLTKQDLRFTDLSFLPLLRHFVWVDDTNATPPQSSTLSPWSRSVDLSVDRTRLSFARLYRFCFALLIAGSFATRIGRLETEFIRRVGDAELLQQSTVRCNILFTFEFAA